VSDDRLASKGVQHGGVLWSLKRRMFGAVFFFCRSGVDQLRELRRPTAPICANVQIMRIINIREVNGSRKSGCSESVRRIAINTCVLAFKIQ
jgi:hypothetical protein